jgi:hypothetical protein
LLCANQNAPRDRQIGSQSSLSKFILNWPSLLLRLPVFRMETLPRRRLAFFRIGDSYHTYEQSFVTTAGRQEAARTLRHFRTTSTLSHDWRSAGGWKRFGSSLASALTKLENSKTQKQQINDKHNQTYRTIQHGSKENRTCYSILQDIDQ